MDATLEVVKRETRGKNEANRLRASGRIPAVVYGAREGQASSGTPVAVDPKAVLRILHSESGANTLITLRLNGTESRVMLKEYQLDPITHALLHGDCHLYAGNRVFLGTAAFGIAEEQHDCVADELIDRCAVFQRDRRHLA